MSYMKKKPLKPRRRNGLRQKNFAKFQIPKDTQIDFKNLPLLQKFLTDRGKIVARRISGVTAKQQRQITSSIKQARYLGLLTVGAVK